MCCVQIKQTMNFNLCTWQCCCTPLHYGADCGHSEVVSILLAANADVNKMDYVRHIYYIPLKICGRKLVWFYRINFDEAAKGFLVEYSWLLLQILIYCGCLQSCLQMSLWFTDHRRFLPQNFYGKQLNKGVMTECYAYVYIHPVVLFMHVY